MNPSLKPFVEAFIEQETLPPEYFQTVEQWFFPLVEDLLHDIASHQGTYVIGVSGCQGSGKSTLAALLVMLLHKSLGLRCINLSIDDFYLGHEARQALGKKVHPLLATRGVPGTHDVPLAINTLTALKNSGAVKIPRFDKAVDDQQPFTQWQQVHAPMDVIVLEGWCLSISAQDDAALEKPVNDLEAGEDADGIWRKYVNDAIKENYLELYDTLDTLIMLKAPSFDQVYQWRQNQENKLALKSADSKGNKGIMSATQLKRFIQHYERVTRHGLDVLPESADVVFQLTDEQTIAQRLK